MPKMMGLGVVRTWEDAQRSRLPPDEGPTMEGMNVNLMTASLGVSVMELVLV